MEVEEILSKLIRIPSVNPPGGETKVAEFLTKLFNEAGIENETMESAPGRGSFIARMGSGPKSLLFLSHADVVPAGDGWDFDPFCGEIKNGMVYGRGALDCKGLVAAEAYAMLQLRKRKLNGRLIFAATADEESGGRNGVRFLLEKYPEKLQADFAVNEGGEDPTIIGGRPTYFIQVGEKGTAWTHLKFSGVSAHGAVPTLGDNAVVKASQAIVRLTTYKAKIKIMPELKGFLNHLGQQAGWKSITARNIDAFLNAYPDRNVAETLRSLTRMTISPNAVEGGSKTNIVPDSCEVDVDIRVLPGQDKESVLQTIRSLVGDQTAIELRNFSPPSFSLTGTPSHQLIEQAVKETLGDIDCFPNISAGATDSRYLRLAGIPSYGPAVAAPDFDPSLKQTVHGKNERTDIKSLKLNVDFLVRLARHYLG
ncbi:MAG: M20/M25/M40 family metallo-hydrolase [Chloroflexota bacterium]